MAIPWGGTKLIRFVRENARIPAIETGTGIVHTYFDRDGDPGKSQFRQGGDPGKSQFRQGGDPGKSQAIVSNANHPAISVRNDPTA